MDINEDNWGFVQSLRSFDLILPAGVALVLTVDLRESRIIWKMGHQTPMMDYLNYAKGYGKTPS